MKNIKKLNLKTFIKFIFIYLILFSFDIKNIFSNNLNKANKKSNTIEFYFKDKKIIDLINLLTKKKGVNYIISQKAAVQNDLKKQLVTYQPKEKNITLEKAWELLILFLELSGYSMYEKEKNLYEILPVGVSGTANIGIFREPLPLYVNTNPDDLPNNEKRIRYVYYLYNIKLSESKDDPISLIIKDMSSPGSLEPFILPKLNGFILVDKANVIASIIKIISELDSTGFRESIEVIPLYNTSAVEVAKIFETLKKAAGEEKTSPFIRADTKASISYFASDTQIVADNRNNSLIIMGRQTAVERIKDFIHNFVDITKESGKSILHYYDLEYLSAQDFAPILQAIVTNQTSAKQGSQSGGSGPEKNFSSPVIQAEKNIIQQPIQGPMDTETVRTPEDKKFDAKGITGTVKTGGNRLIIAAMPDDWQKIKEIIRKLDQPQPQIILEVFVADITHTKDKIISGTIRNKRTDQLISGVDFLSSNITPPNNVLGTTPKTLVSDLLKLATSTDGLSPVSSLITPGSLILSFSDPTTPSDGLATDAKGNAGGIWALIQILDKYTNLTVITHPFVVSLNNTKATIFESTVKRERGDATPSQSGVISVGIDNIPASIQIQMIPRISSENRLNLQVGVDVDEFISSTSLTRTTKRVETDSYLNSGDVLVIGGLTRVDTTDSVTQTPILGQIPIIGRFFQGVQKTITTTNLIIMISPTIIIPKFRSGLNLHTKDKLEDFKFKINDKIIYGDNRDPITYLFLPNKDANTNNNIISEFEEQTKNIGQYDKDKTKKLIKKAEEELKREKIKAKNINKRYDTKKNKKIIDVPA